MYEKFYVRKIAAVILSTIFLLKNAKKTCQFHYVGNIRILYHGLMILLIYDFLKVIQNYLLRVIKYVVVQFLRKKLVL